MKTLTTEAKIENIPKVTDFIDAELEALDCPIKAQMQLDVAVDEVFTNIASYAYEGGTGEATVTLDFDPEKREVCLTFEDNGVPFDPTAQPEPDTTLSAEEREIGGLGIFLVKKTMDAVRYVRQGDVNVLEIRKRI